MADGKKSFLLYCDLIHTVKKLPKDVRGDLFLLILEYVNDLNPVVENNLVLEVCFEPIKQQLKRDLKEWEGEKLDRSVSGIIGNIARWHPDIYKQLIDKQISLPDALIKIESLKSHSDKSESDGIANIANIAVNATVNVTDTVKDTVTNSNGKYPTLATSAVGGEKVKTIANDVWKDKNWRDSLCIGLSLNEGSLKKWMALFNASVAEDAVEDFTEKRYKRMIRGWILKQKDKGVVLVEDKLEKTSSSAPLKKLSP